MEKIRRTLKKYGFEPRNDIWVRQNDMNSTCYYVAKEVDGIMVTLYAVSFMETEPITQSTDVKIPIYQFYDHRRLNRLLKIILCR